MKLKKGIKLLIAVDGGAGSGKTTGAKLISKKYDLELLTTGLLYRYIAYKLLQKNNIRNKTKFIKKLVKKINQTKLKNKKLFNQNVTKHSAIVAQSKNIRNILKRFQKDFAKKNLVCIEGRDIGSIICPNADIKFFFKCSNINIKAKRRLADFRKTNKKITLDEVKKALKLRDYLDKTRKHSPLRVLKDHIVIDSSKVNKKQMLNKLSKLIEKKLKEKYGEYR